MKPQPSSSLPPLCAIEATNPYAKKPEMGKVAIPGEFTLYLDQPAQRRIVIDYDILGDAVEQEDYQPLNEAVIEQNETDVRIPVIPEPLTHLEHKKAITLRLHEGDGYRVDAHRAAVEDTVLIQPYGVSPPRPPLVTLRTLQSKAVLQDDSQSDRPSHLLMELSEGLQEDLNVRYSVQLSDGLKSAQVCTLEDDEGNMLDLEPWGNVVIIPAGQKTLQITVAARAQATAVEQWPQTIRVTLLPSDVYRVHREWQQRAGTVTLLQS